MRDRLIELLKVAKKNRGMYSSEGYLMGATFNIPLVEDKYVELLADHLLVEGVIVPPCKVGGTVYVVSNYYGGEWRIYECRVDNFTVYKTNIFMSISDRECYNFGANICEIGKTIFLTKEEAEKALERSENGK